MVRSVVYLKSGVQIKSETGQKSDSYILDEEIFDTERPVCKVASVTPLNPTIECTDDSKSLTSEMTAENINVKIDGETTTLSKKELSESTDIEGGIRHTLTLEGFQSAGTLS